MHVLLLCVNRSHTLEKKSTHTREKQKDTEGETRAQPCFKAFGAEKARAGESACVGVHRQVDDSKVCEEWCGCEGREGSEEDVTCGV